MKRCFFALLAVLFTTQLYALNAEPPALRLQKFKCEYHDRTPYVGVVVDEYRCDKNMGISLEVVYYDKPQPSEEQWNTLQGYLETDPRLRKIRQDVVDDERGLALYKVEFFPDTQMGNFLLMRFDEDKRIIFRATLPLGELQKFASNKSAEELLQAMLTLKVPPHP